MTQLTPKQRVILEALHGPGFANWPTIDELVARAGFTGASKQAMQQTLRSMERRGWILRRYERRGERVHLVIEPTPAGSARIGMATKVVRNADG